MDIALIVIFLLLGIFLLILEIFFLPGTTIAGIASAFFIIASIWMSFSTFGTTVGWYTIAGTVVASVIAIYLFIRSNAMDKFSLKAEIESRIDPKDISIQVGDIGKSLSRLAPIGKANINGITTEVKSVDGFIDVESEIKVIDVSRQEILVKKIETLS